MVFKCLSMPDFAYRSIFFHLKVISNQHRTKVLANPLQKYSTELTKLNQTMSMSIKRRRKRKKGQASIAQTVYRGIHNYGPHKTPPPLPPPPRARKKNLDMPKRPFCLCFQKELLIVRNSK